jgi:hypothetical protein
VLVEAVAALLIISVAGIAVLAMLSSQLRAATQADIAVRASALLEERLSRMESLPRRELDRLSDSLRAGHFPPPFDEFTWTASSTPRLGDAELYDVQVNVSWSDGSASVSTRLFRSGSRAQ